MSSLSADVRCSALSSANMNFSCAERSSGPMSARYELAALSQDGIHFNVVLMSGTSSAPSSEVRGSAQCSQPPNSQTAHSQPWAENHDFLEKATITWLASSNWSVAHLARSAALFSKVARHSRRQGLLCRSRRSPGPTACGAHGAACESSPSPALEHPRLNRSKPWFAPACDRKVEASPPKTAPHSGCKTHARTRWPVLRTDQCCPTAP